MQVKFGSRTFRSPGRKFAVYQATVSGRKVFRGQSIKLYFDGQCDLHRVQSEVIPKVQQYVRSNRPISFPLVIQSYFSKGPTLKASTSGARRQPDSGSRILEFLIDQLYRVTKLDEDGTVPSD